MEGNVSITESYESLPKIAKLILQIFLGALIGGVYRIIRYTETQNIVTLVVGILGLVTFVGNIVLWLVDLYTEWTENRITFLAD